MYALTLSQQFKQCNSHANELTISNQDLYKHSTTPIAYPNTY